MLIQWWASSQCSVSMSSPSSGPWAGPFGWSNATDAHYMDAAQPAVAELFTPLGVGLVHELGTSTSRSARHRRGDERWGRFVGHGGRARPRRRVLRTSAVLERHLLRGPRDGGVGPGSHPPTHGRAIPSGP